MFDLAGQGCQKGGPNEREKERVSERRERERIQSVFAQSLDSVGLADQMVKKCSSHNGQRVCKKFKAFACPVLVKTLIQDEFTHTREQCTASCKEQCPECMYRHHRTFIAFVPTIVFI